LNLKMPPIVHATRNLTLGWNLKKKGQKQLITL